MARVRLIESAHGTIRQHARDAYPHECCGALFGNGAGIVEALALPNTTEEGPRRRFLVRPADYTTAEAHASSSGLALVGFYHSHPDHPARPSQHDLDHAWPNLIYVITAVLQGQPLVTTAWTLREDRSRFDEVPLD